MINIKSGSLAVQLHTSSVESTVIGASLSEPHTGR